MLSFCKHIRTAAIAAGIFAAACMSAGCLKAQGSAQARVFTAADYVGTWHLMFQGKAFATMTVQQSGDQLSGSLTGVSISMDDQGKLTRAVATDGPVSTLRVTFAGGVLHVTEKDEGDDVEWAMTLSSPNAGELQFAGGGAPANAEAIRVEKLWSEPPVQP